MVALVLFLVTLVAAVFWLRPSWDEVNSLSLGRDDLLNQKQQLNQKLTDLQHLQESLNAGSEVSKQTTLTAIPEKFEQDQLILDLNKIAKDNDIILNGVNFSIPSVLVPGQVSKATITSNLTGNQSQLISFLRSVENNTRKMLVKSITVQVGKTADGIGRVNFNVNIEVYFQGAI